jgi:hypothetical protein
MQEITPRRGARGPDENAAIHLLIGAPPALAPDIARPTCYCQPAPAVLWAHGGYSRCGPPYALCDSTQGGLLARCGYATLSESPAERRQKVPQFLEDLAYVVDVLGLYISTYDHWNGRIITLEEMRSLARFDFGLDRLVLGRVSVGAPETYLWNWTCFFTEYEGYPWPTRANSCWLDAGGIDAEDMFFRLERLGLTQAQLSVVLNVCPSLITKLKRAQRRWSSRLLARATTFVAAAEKHVVATVHGHW